MKQTLIILLVYITPLNLLVAQEQKTGKSTNTTNTTQNSDQNFMEKAAESGVAEVMFGKLAQKQASSQKVKDYGTMMEKDHSKANQELIALAKQQNISLPTTLSAPMQNDYDALKKKNGNDFDKSFMEQMIADHQKAINLFESEVKTGKNEQVRTWAERTLPTLKHHLEHAREIRNNLK